MKTFKCNGTKQTKNPELQFTFSPIKRFREAFHILINMHILKKCDRCHTQKKSPT